MLDYIAEIMEDAQDFGWASAKGVCRMEEGKVEWHMTEIFFFQTGKCSHTNDHVTNGHSYKHICSHCFGLGKRFPHPQEDCRNAKKNKDAKNE